MTWIEPDALAASSLPFMPEDIRSLASQGIRAIVSLTEHPITRFRGVEEALAAQAIAYLNSPIDDHHANTTMAATIGVDARHQPEDRRAPHSCTTRRTGEGHRLVARRARALRSTDRVRDLHWELEGIHRELRASSGFSSR